MVRWTFSRPRREIIYIGNYLLKNTYIMDKKKTLETIGDVIITIIAVAVGSLVFVTAITFLYHMIAAIFD